MRKRYELSDDEEIHIMQADSMKQVVDWKKLCQTHIKIKNQI